MKKTLLLLLLGTIVTIVGYSRSVQIDTIISYEVSPSQIKFFHQDDKGNVFGNFANLKTWLDHHDKKLVFGMNGGMYLRNLSPQGLYIEDGKQITNLNTIQTAYGNFYMQPNGVFYITKDGIGHVVTTKDFKFTMDIKYATQSGPMLLINGKYHHKFNPRSKHVHIRNGVGVLPNGNLLFAISRDKITFYDFATFFRSKGCKNALYLDGFVSRIYLVEQNITDQDGLFGIIIAQTVDKK